MNTRLPIVVIFLSCSLACRADDPPKAMPKRIVNSIGMKLVLIPAGQFMMGSPDSGSEHDIEKPRHRVRITKPFYLGTTEVTQRQYEKVMGDNPSYLKESSPDAPVECVSWNDAQEFCRKLSELAEEKRAGRLYRLPTEAEWEYACRAGCAEQYCYGDGQWQLGDYAWYAKNSNEKKHPVGRKKPNAWGLYDMHGNVAEWCEDKYDRQYYANSPTDDPRAFLGGQDRVYRGGGWPLDAENCRSAHRDYNDRWTRFNCLGLRVATVPLPSARESVGLRTWTDATGKHRVEAELIDLSDGVVRLRKEDEQVIEVPVEKLSPADRRFLEEKSAGEELPRDGFLVDAEDGLYFVDLNGKTEPFAKTQKVVGRPAVRGSRVFVPGDGAIREFDVRGRLVRAIAIENLALPRWDPKAIRQELSRSRLLALPRGGFALLSPGSDRCYFLDQHGVWKRTVEILGAANWPGLLGTVVGEGLLISNIHMKDVRRVDLKTFKTEVYMRSDRSLGPIAFDPQRQTCYVCSGAAIHAVSMKGNRGQPNVSQAPKIAKVQARFQYTTVQPHFISGIALHEECAYVTLLPYDCIVRVNIATGDPELFVEGLTHPGAIVRLKQPN